MTYPTPTAATFDLDFNTIATDFTFTRNSEATFVNAQGLIQSTNEIGAELITNGSFEEGLTNWSAYAGAISIETSIVHSGTQSAKVDGVGIQQSYSYTIGQEISYSFWVYSTVGTNVYIQTTNQNITIPLNEWFEVKGRGTVSNINTSFRVRVSGGIWYLDNVSVKEYITETNTPRLDYSTGAEAFLLEPQRTNFIQYSELFSDVSWQKSNITATLSNEVNPSGDSSSYKIIEGSGLNNKQLYQSKTNFTTTDSNSFSVFAQKGERDIVQVVFGSTSFDEGSIYANFDLTNGTITQGEYLSAKITSFANGWYRCEVTATPTTSGASFTYVVAPKISSTSVRNEDYLGDGTSGVYIYGAQVEQGSYATSYIPNNGEANGVTRNQELCNNATPVINSEEGVLYAEISALTNDDSTNRYISLSDGSADNSVRIYFSSNGIQLSGQLRSEGGLQCLFDYTVPNLLSFNKVAFKYKQDNFSFWINGVEVATDTSGAAPIGLNKLSFNRGDGNQTFFGNTKGLKYYPKALSDVELETLTSWSSFREMAEAQSYIVE